MVLLILTLLVVLILLRMWSILPHKARRAPLKSSKPTRSLAAFLGSGKWASTESNQCDILKRAHG